MGNALTFVPQYAYLDWFTDQLKPRRRATSISAAAHADQMNPIREEPHFESMICANPEMTDQTPMTPMNALEMNVEEVKPDKEPVRDFWVLYICTFTEFRHSLERFRMHCSRVSQHFTSLPALSCSACWMKRWLTSRSISFFCGATKSAAQSVITLTVTYKAPPGR